MDPSLEDGSACVFDREVPFEMRIQDPNSGPQEVGTLETIRVKILTTMSNQRNLQRVKIELTSENDLFFNYVCQIDEDSFQ